MAKTPLELPAKFDHAGKGSDSLRFRSRGDEISSYPQQVCGHGRIPRRRRGCTVIPVERKDAALVETRPLTLVTTDDCHFCQRAHVVLGRLDVGAREISVDSPEAAALADGGLPLAFLPVLTDGERV